MSFDEKTSLIDASKLAALAQEREERSACFIVIAGGQVGRMYKLDFGELVVGRFDDAGIRIDDDGVSRRHARIVRQVDGSVAISDLGSTNGTFCNGEKITSRTLQDGDKIQIGTTTILKFSFQDSLEEDFQRRQYESATRDALTGCFNKKYFLERLPNEIAFVGRHHKHLSVAMLDIDHFKKINDTHGHLAGDYVLRNISKIMQANMRADDILCRYGGEEFALIMRETPPDSALIAVERIRLSVQAAKFVFKGTDIPVTVSCGIGTWETAPGRSPATPEGLIAEADQHLYAAKNAGRNQTKSGLL